MSHATGRNTKYGTSPKTFQTSLLGFTGSLILTLLAFGLVWTKTFSVPTTYILLALLAVTQLFVQVVYFLRINTSPEGRWNLMPFLFTLLIIAVLACGSLWIMYNLNYNMMH